MIVFPLRVTELIPNLREQLSHWTNSQDGIKQETSTCLDVDRFCSLREDCAAALSAGPETAVTKLDRLQEYAAALDVLRSKQSNAGSSLGPNMSIQWSWAIQGTLLYRAQRDLMWEFINVIWNVAALTAYQAFISTSSATTPSSLTPQQRQTQQKQAAASLEQTAVLIRYISSLMSQWQNNASSLFDVFFSSTALKLYQSWLCALAQRCGYKLFSAYPAPKHFVLAKLSLAILVPFLDEAEQASQLICSQLEKETASRDTEKDVVVFWSEWANTIRVWHLYFSALTEYHQAKAHAEKKGSEVALEAARLVAGTRFSTLCRERIESSNTTTAYAMSQPSKTKVEAILLEMNTRLQQIKSDSAQKSLRIPDYATLTHIRPQSTVKLGCATTVDQAIVSKLLPPLATPLFVKCDNDKPPAAQSATSFTPSPPVIVSDPPPVVSMPRSAPGSPKKTSTDNSVSAHSAASRSSKTTTSEPVTTNPSTILKIGKKFRRDMERMYSDLMMAASKMSDQARRILSENNLPHALTHYRQEVAVGTADSTRNECSNPGNGSTGLPIELWERVQQIQRQRKVTELKRQSWELRDLAETAHTTYEHIVHQLQEDVTLDAKFRDQYEDFEGFDVKEVQEPFQQPLETYKRLLTSAQESDELLLQRCQVLDTDPKFRLLNFQRSQLDHLLPASNNVVNSNSNVDTPLVDVSALSQYLVDLSTLFDEQEKMLQILKQNIAEYSFADAVAKTLKESPADAALQKEEEVYSKAIDTANKEFKAQFEAIQESMEKQKGLLQHILEENGKFVRARGANGGAAAQSSASGAARAADSSCIVTKIEEALEEIGQFSAHLENGRDFYDVMLPKLEKLSGQVDDVSTRLAIERFEYEESQQEGKDAGMAAILAAGDSQSGFRVDDQKVATLVAMGFETEQAGRALTDHNNDIDRALNDLLSG